MEKTVPTCMFVINDRGELAVLIREQHDDETSPYVAVNGKNAVLHRNPRSVIELGVLNDDVASCFSRRKSALIIEVSEETLLASRSVFPSQEDVIACYEADIIIKLPRNATPEQTAIDYYIMLPEGKQGMLLIQSQPGKPKFPVILFDDSNVVLKRGSVNIPLGSVAPQVIDGLKKRRNILVAEVPPEVFSHARENPPKETDFTACYEAQVYAVDNVRKELPRAGRGWLWLLRTTGFAALFTLAVGFGINQIIPGSDTYTVRADTEKGKAFVASTDVSCTIQNTVKIYFADIHRGKKIFEYVNPENGKKEILSAENVDDYGLSPVYTVWARYGIVIVLVASIVFGAILAAFGGNLLYRLQTVAEAMVD